MCHKFWICPCDLKGHRFLKASPCPWRKSHLETRILAVPRASRHLTGRKWGGHMLPIVARPKGEGLQAKAAPRISWSPAMQLCSGTPSLLFTRCEMVAIALMCVYPTGLREVRSSVCCQFYSPKRNWWWGVMTGNCTRQKGLLISIFLTMKNECPGGSEDLTFFHLLPMKSS